MKRWQRKLVGRVSCAMRGAAELIEGMAERLEEAARRPERQVPLCFMRNASRARLSDIIDRAMNNMTRQVAQDLLHTSSRFWDPAAIVRVKGDAIRVNRIPAEEFYRGD